MRFSTAAAAAALSASVIAAPTPAAKGPTDVQILQYALTLEHLEDTFYRQGLANFTQAQFASQGFGASFYSNLKEISKDEATHVAFLTTALGSVANAACSYNFPYSDPKSFVALASILEGVGVSAYLGAAASIAQKAYLTAAGSILTVEARHSSFIRNSLSEVPFPSPFDTPLDFDEVYSLAAQFITGCPSTNQPLPVKKFPTLEVLNAPSPVMTNSSVYLIGSPAFNLPKKVYAAFPTVTGPVFSQNVTMSSNGQSAWITIPEGVSGQTYVVLTNKMKVTDETIIAGPAIIEVATM